MSTNLDKKFYQADEFIDSYVKSITQMAFTKEEKEDALKVLHHLGYKIDDYVFALEDELTNDAQK